MTTATSTRTYMQYHHQLERFISLHKSRPPDIKFWPYGPYWPTDYSEIILETPVHLKKVPPFIEPLQQRCNLDEEHMNCKTVDTQVTKYTNKWRGTHIVFDSEKSGKDYIPPGVQEGNCPSLTFESRFESGNLRQARRVGQFEYELVLKTDLYTNRHTQWFYFRVQNMVPGIVYKFIIVNLLKKDSLYNHGMQPLFYSEHDAHKNGIGWVRRGHHVNYSRNVTHLNCPILNRDRAHFMLEWQVEFSNADDSCYFAHCYPYTYTDLKDDLDGILADPRRGPCMKREVMCETRAGNSCFLLTITNFSSEPSQKKRGVVVTGRVHPGETNASWMMKGLLEFLTGTTQIAQDIRDNYIFKIVPMLNPDGVIVGNYRCSLAARDLNRNYRHPRKENFPTIWHTKIMTEEFSKDCEIVMYCDMHGHSRKSQVFMYGCDPSYNHDPEAQNQMKTPQGVEAFINERLFPWLMSKKSPEKFSFKGCKFHIRRCKEATGRVVMWRQMRIMNSFTMEATFSGTPVSREDSRHFNIGDFQDMGRLFCETILDYQQTMENQEKRTCAVVDITRAVTHQILQSKGIVAPELLKILDGPDTENQDVKATKITQVLLQLLTGEKPAKPPKGKRSPKTAEETDLNQLMNSISDETIQGCFKILEQLNIAEDFEESDSSDSDSESDAELPKAPDSKRKKKKKSRKQRDRDQGQRRDRSDSKSVSALPAINSADGSKEKKKQDAKDVKGKPKVMDHGTRIDLRFSIIQNTHNSIYDPNHDLKYMTKYNPVLIPLFHKVKKGKALAYLEKSKVEPDRSKVETGTSQTSMQIFGKKVPNPKKVFAKKSQVPAVKAAWKRPGSGTTCTEDSGVTVRYSAINRMMQFRSYRYD